MWHHGKGGTRRTGRGGVYITGRAARVGQDELGCDITGRATRVQSVVGIKKTGFGWHGFFLNGFRVADTYQGFFLNCFWKLSTFAAQPPKSSQKCPHCSNRLVAPV